MSNSENTALQTSTDDLELHDQDTDIRTPKSLTVVMEKFTASCKELLSDTTTQLRYIL